jgi:CelD/BcsL family acetyltransferase involved in cellulose biosynthesis
MYMPAVMNLTTTRLDSCTMPGALAGDWNRLAGDIPCRQWDWLEPWWRHYGTANDELFVLGVHDLQGELLGIAPWYLSRTIRHGRVVRFLGSGDVCSDYLTILAGSERRSAVVGAIADYLTGTGAGDWDMIELNGVLANDEATLELIERLTERDYRVHRQPGESCWRLDLPPDWESYVKLLSKTRRERTRQIVREAFDSGRAVSRQVVERCELPDYFDLLVDLHQKRRRSMGTEGSFADAKFKLYHREVMERFFAMGRLRLQYVRLDDRPIAIEYGLIGGKAIYFYQSGIETEVLDQRPGWMGTIGSLRAAIEQGYQTFDFMRGDEAYKASWRAQAQPTLEVRIVAPRAAAQLRHTAWLAERQVRQWAKARWRRMSGNGKGVA